MSRAAIIALVFAVIGSLAVGFFGGLANEPPWMLVAVPIALYIAIHPPSTFESRSAGAAVAALALAAGWIAQYADTPLAVPLAALVAVVGGSVVAWIAAGS